MTPADDTDALLLLPAPRMCVCGHPVYDDQEIRCALCACREHRLRSRAAQERGVRSSARDRDQKGAS